MTQTEVLRKYSRYHLWRCVISASNKQ